MCYGKIVGLRTRTAGSSNSYPQVV